MQGIIFLLGTMKALRWIVESCAKRFDTVIICTSPDGEREVAVYLPSISTNVLFYVHFTNDKKKLSDVSPLK